MTPPKYLVLQQKLIAKTPQNAAKRRKTPQNAAKRRKMPQNAAKCRKMPQNTAKGHKTPQNAEKRRKRAHGPFQFTAKCRKIPENARKCHKTPQNAAKRCKYHELAIRLRGTKYLWGPKNPAPFSGQLKLIVDHNWGATAPFPPENIFSGFFQDNQLSFSNLVPM